MPDPFIDVAVRLHRDHAGRIPFTKVLAVIEACRRDLDMPCADALPELVERLARQRLADPISE